MEWKGFITESKAYMGYGTRWAYIRGETCHDVDFWLIRFNKPWGCVKAICRHIRYGLLYWHV